jgi:lysyl-tRNA synthetase, class II
MSPLAKVHPSSPLLSQRFELFIDKMELVNAYSEENDFSVQKKNFELQNTLHLTNSSDAEIMQTDDHFLEAMSYGMPPTGG